jgi:periplasmic nitrate reductase NapD
LCALRLTAVLIPAPAVATVGAFGFTVWMYQTIAGPPGPPERCGEDGYMPRTRTTIDRRTLLSGGWGKSDGIVRPPGGEIASILVQARPERLDGVEAAIAALPACEIHSRDPKGKLVVVVDAPSAGYIGASRALAVHARISAHRTRHS